MNKKRLLKLADLLDHIPKKSFDMSEWKKSEPTKPEGKKLGECGFAGCAMGWAAHQKLFKNLKFDFFGIEYGPNPPSDGESFSNNFSGFDAAAKCMQITYQDAEYLFSIEHYRSKNPMPATVAKRIRHFVEWGGR